MQDYTARLWEDSSFLFENPKDQVKIACETLWKLGARLAFTRADMLTYPVLQSEPIDPATGDLVSPCKGVLPEAAFRKPAPEQPR